MTYKPSRASSECGGSVGGQSSSNVLPAGCFRRERRAGDTAAITEGEHAVDAADAVDRQDHATRYGLITDDNRCDTLVAPLQLFTQMIGIVLGSIMPSAPGIIPIAPNASVADVGSRAHSGPA